MPVLVTGVGYIGSRLVELLLAAGEEVVAVDNFFATRATSLARLRRHPKLRFIRGDVASEKVLEEALSGGIGTVYSLAAQASAHPDAAPASYTERTNLAAPRMLLDAMVRHGVGRLVFASSLRVYGERLPAELTEDAPYGAFRDMSHLSKCYVEKLMEMYAGNARLGCAAVRLGIVYGVGPVMKDDPMFTTVPSKFCRQAVRGEALQVYRGGSSPIGLIHVDDAAAALMAAAAAIVSGRMVALNAAPEAYSVRRIAGMVAEAARRRGLEAELRIDREQGEAGEVHILSSLPQYGFAARHTLASGIEEMLNYWTAKCGS